MASLMPVAKQQYFDSNGVPLSGGKVYTYAAGTTTPLATYTDSGATTPNANPVVLDSRGEASIFFTAASYKIVLKDSADVTIWTADNLAGDAAASALASLAASGGSALVGFIQSGTGAVATTVQTKLRESVSVKDFGAVGDGVTDDTTAVLNALASGAKRVIVTAATPTPLLTSMITVGAGQVLELECGGKNSAVLPPIYFVKSSSMSTAAIKIVSRGRVVGGGLFCQSGNTGDGVWLAGNSAQLENFNVKGAGQDGVRVGVDGTPYVNCNSNYLKDVLANYNGRHGIYIHDGSTTSAAAATADANLGVLMHCEGSYNGSDGIKIGRAWWWSVINGHTQSNSGWGLNLSNVVTSPDTVAECRYANIFAGDFNESNTSGSAKISGYACAAFIASSNQAISVDGVFCNMFAGGGDSLMSRDLSFRDANRGVVFLGQSSSSGTSTSQVFSAYDEGTFTPVLAGSTSGTLNGTGRYVRTGRLVTAHVEFNAFTTATKPIGNYTVTGLPYQENASETSSAVCDCPRATFTTSIVASLASSTSTVTLVQPVSNAVPSAVTDANFVNASAMYIRFTIAYQI